MGREASGTEGVVYSLPQAKITAGGLLQTWTDLGLKLCGELTTTQENKTLGCPRLSTSNPLPTSVSSQL